MTINVKELNTFIVRAKASTYAGDGEHTTPCRRGSHDLRFADAKWAYHDSYFGGSDFIGEEVVYFAEEPIWAMNYYGRILRDDLVTAEQVGHMIKAGLSHMYKENRFLGGIKYAENGLTYVDTSEGQVVCFRGREFIRRGNDTVYELVYHGGIIRD